MKKNIYITSILTNLNDVTHFSMEHLVQNSPQQTLQDFRQALQTNFSQNTQRSCMTQLVEEHDGHWQAKDIPNG